GKSFTFRIEGSEGAPMPEKDGVAVTTVTTDENSQGGSQTLSFGTVEFEAADSDTSTNKVSYTYTITEVPGTYPDVDYDPAVYTVTLDTYTVREGNNWVAKVEKDGEAYTGETFNFENKVATGTLTLTKNIAGWWRVACETMGDSVSVNDSKQTNETHRKAFCGDATHYEIKLDENGVPVEMYEIKTDNLGTLECYLYTDGTYTTPKDISTIEPNTTIYWITKSGNREWRHYGTVHETVTKGSYDFTVMKDGKYYNADGVPSETEQVISVKAGEKIVLDKLPVGTYEISEVNIGNIYSVSVSEKNVPAASEPGTETTSEEKSTSSTEAAPETELTVKETRDSETGDGKASVNVSIGSSKEGIAEISFLNTVETGTLRIRKEVTPDIAAYNDIPFYVTVTGPYGFEKRITVKKGEDGVVSLTDIPLGTYTIVETDENGNPLPQNSPYNISMSDGGVQTSTTDNILKGTVTLSNNGDVKLVKINNKIGSLTVNKAVVSVSEKVITEDFYVTVMGSDGKYYDESGASYDTARIITLSVKSGANAAAVIPNLPFGRYTVTEVNADGSAIDTNEFMYDISPQTQTVDVSASSPAGNVTITNTEKRTGELHITKKGEEEGEVLQDVVFTLEKDGRGVVLTQNDGSYVYSGLVPTDQNGVSEAERVVKTELVTNAEGVIIVKELPVGNYKLIEERTITGYELPEVHSWDYGINNSVVEANIPNSRTRYSLEIVKTGKGAPLAGAGFTLYNENGSVAYNEKETVLTGDEGARRAVVTFDKLVWGKTYYYEETKTPDGFEPDRTPKEARTFTVGSVNEAGQFRVDPHTRVITATVDNTPVKGELHVVKKDAQDKALAGAQFMLYKDNTLIYVLDNRERKADPEAEDGYVYTTGGSGDTVLVSDSEGKVDVYGLPAGNYRLMETATPDDSRYIRSEDKTFSIPLKDATGNILKNEDGSYRVSASVDVKNGTFAAGVRFRKVYKDGNSYIGLDGAKFDLYKEGSDQVYESFESKNGGYVEAGGLEIGSYYFTETDAPAGYDRPDDSVNKLTFSITAEDQGKVKTLDVSEIVELVDDLAFVKNERSKASVILEKKEGSVTGELIDGITFSLYKTDSQGNTNVSERDKVAVGVTGKSYDIRDGQAVEITGGSKGRLSITGLDWGYYFLREESDENNQKYVIAGEGKTPVFYLGSDHEGGVLTKEFTGANAVVNSIKKGSVIMRKVDKETGAALNGAVFYLYKDAEKKDQVEGSPFTVTNGTIKVDNLEYGTYWFVEKDAPAGYKTDTEVHEVVINGEIERDQTVDYELTVENERQLGEVTLRKWGEKKSETENAEADLLSGAKFTLYSAKNHKGVVNAIKSFFSSEDYYEYGTYTLSSGQGNGTDIIAENGKLTLKELPWDNYYFIETEAPTGYRTETLNEQNKEYRFTIGLIENGEAKAPNLVVSVDAYNEMELGTIKLTKVDKANSETKLKGAVFELYKQGKQSYDENGEPIDFSGEPVRESDTRYPNSSTVYTTDGNGEIVVPDVEWGTYYFKEITPPEGYELPQNAVTDTITINPSTGNDSGEITVQNEKIFGSIKVKKVDDNDAPLSGASFVVTKVTDGREANVELEGVNGEYTFKSLLDSLWERLTSRGTEAQVKDAGDNKGCLTISGLPYGTYKVYEYSAPEGYKKVETPYEFTIDSQGKGNDAQFYPFKNSLIQGKVKFYKTGLDKNNNQVGLEGAVFHLYEYRKTNGEIDRTIEPIDHSTVTSDRNGLVEKAGLGVGTYYFVEEIPPAGYEIKTGTDGEPLKYEFSVTEADDNNYVSFESSMSPYGTEKAVENDQAKGIVKLFKADKADLTRGLDGAEFSLFEKGNESPVTTGLKSGSTYYYEEGSFNEATGEKEEGCLIIKGLGWGTYYLKETKAPEGYALDANKEYEFKVEAANTGKRLSGNELTDVVITQGTNKRELTVVNELILGKAQFTK
ncbi:MAG: hypothetical protein IJR19_05930, partial [Lachnospiraceae bacterium]|nr:hypothetical protein [Lachnospiraceae bacterium]